MQHIHKILVRAHIGVVSNRRGKPLRNILCRNDHDFSAFYKRFRLFGGKNDVFVVRENKYGFRINPRDSVCNVACGRVHRLPAFYNDVDVKFLEKFGKPVALRNRNYTDRLTLFLVFFNESAVLFEHILDFYFIDLAELQRFRYRKPRVIGVNVNFNEFEIAYTNNAVAYGVEIFSQPVDIGGRRFLFEIYDEKFGAIPEFNGSEVQNIRPCRFGFGFLDFLHDFGFAVNNNFFAL